MRLIPAFLLAFLSVSLLFTACRKDDAPSDPGISGEEYKYIRILVSDAVSTEITQVNPSDGSTETFNAPYPNAALYPTASKRFGALLFGAENHVQFFDCGFEYHGDHVDMKGTPKFGYMTGDGKKPTHYKSRGTETIIFNDGDGTLSVADEIDFHTRDAKMKIINAGLTPHHGAMAQFDNGTYAVTVADPSSSLAGPHAVKIIDKTGAEVHPARVAVSRLHGNATDGQHALFGVDGGILVVQQNGEQRIIPNPEGFGDVRLGTVLEAAGVNKFVGYSAAKGAYFIDLDKNELTPIIEATDILQCKTDYTGNQLIVLHHSGNLKIYDLASGVLKKEGSVMSAVATTETIKPLLEATSKYVYITMPSTGELHRVNSGDLSDIKKINVSGKPSRLAVLGFETNESH